MTNHTTNDNEHIRAAVQLVGAKARNRIVLLQQRVGAAPALAEEIEELERIDRMTASAWQELNQQTAGD
jgi:hypothetical protein